MRRLALRRLRADDGLSLVETVVALMVFSLILTGLAASAAFFVHDTLVTKARNAATALAQKLMEQDRAIGYSDLETCTTGAPADPITFNSHPYNVAKSNAGNCITYQPPAYVSNGFTFTTKTLVLTAASGKNTAGQPVTEKYIQIIVSWAAPTSGSYELDSVVDNNGVLAPDPAQGIRIDPQDSGGTSLTTAEINFDYTVTDSTNTVVATGQTDEGQQPLVNLAPGTYTCTAAENDSSANQYDPGSNSGDVIGTNANNFQTISGTCTVTAGSVLIWTTVWTAVSNCASSGAKGTLQVSVTDQNNAPVSGASVSLTNVNGNAGTPGAVTTNSSGVALFNNTVPADLYTYTLTKNGYATASNLGPVCVAANATAKANGTLKGSSCPSVTAKGSVSVTVTNPGGTGLANAVISLVNQSGKANPATVKTNAQGVALFNNTVTGDTYLWNVNAPTGYTDQLNIGPVCVPSATTTYLSAVIYTQGSSGCAVSKTKGSLSVSVTDQNGTAVSGATVTLNNLDGNGQPGAIKTNTSGVALFNATVQADLYTYTVTPPAGYLDPGVQGLPGICVIAGQTVTASTALVGVMTVKVSITNSDTQPTKTYIITLTDSGNGKTSQSLSVNRTKTGTVTFTSMPTDTYTIDACVNNTQIGNCDSVASASGTFTTLGTTYTVSMTDTKGGS